MGATAQSISPQSTTGRQQEFVAKKLSPVLVVDRIEPCLKFWESIGFKNVSEVKDEDRLAFVMLAKDNVTIMYQTKASVAKDVPALANIVVHPSTFLYIEVSSLDAVIQKLKDVPVVVPERTTFYGAREIGVREPGGNSVTFAEFKR